MFIFIYGEESYLCQLKLLEIINQYKKTLLLRNKKANSNKANLLQCNNIPLCYLDFAENSFKDFIRETTQSSIFQQKKMIILKNCFLNFELTEVILSHLQKLKFQDTVFLILFYEDSAVDKKNKLFKFLKKQAQAQEMKKLKGKDLSAWVSQEIRSHNIKMNFENQQLLIQFCGNDLWRLANEIKKLALYKYPEKEISEKDIKKMVEPIIRTDIFKTIDALAIKDKKKALFLVHNHFKKNEHPLYILLMIIYQFRNLLMIKFLLKQAEKSGQHLNISDMITTTKLHPFVVRKTLQQASKFTFKELQKKYQQLLDLDIDIKTGKIESFAGLNSFLLS